MKHMRKIALLLAVLILTAAFPAQGVSAVAIGDKLGNVLNSNIKAFINDNRIPSYNIANKTVIVAEDLASYGFDVAWNAANRSVSIKLSSGKKITPIAAADNTKTPGTVAFPYVYTDIVAYVNGKKVESFNVQGKTVIYFSALEEYGTFKWDAANSHSRFYTNASSSSSSTSTGKKVGDVLGNVLNSNIKAFINGQRIPSYNIANKTVILAEDLANYGFDVSWNSGSRSVFITLNSSKSITPLPAEDNTKKPGTPAFSYVYTDIITYVNNKKVESFNLQGKTAIYFSALEEYGTFSWDVVNSHSMLSTSFSISGRVGDAGNATALQGVTVVLKNKSGGTVGTTTTISDGSYEFKNVASGVYTVEFSLSDYSAAKLNVTVSNADATKQNINMNKEKRTVSGKIFAGNTTAGLQGATVNLKRLNGGIIATSTSRSDGSYEFSDVAIGSYTVEASMNGYTSASTASFSVSNADVANRNLALEVKGASVSGVVYNGDSYNNNRVSGASVSLKTTGGSTVYSTSTDYNGEYMFDNIAAGTYVVEAQMTGYTSASTQSFSVGLYDITSKNVSINPSGYSINGYIIDGDLSYNNGVSGATVKLKNSGGTVIQTVTSQSNGSYSFTGLTQTSYSSYTVEVTASGYATVSQTFSGTITNNINNFNITVTKNGTYITGRYRSSTSSSITIYSSTYGEVRFTNISSSISTSGFSYDDTIYIYYTGSLTSSGGTSNATVTSISRTASSSYITGRYRDRTSSSITIYNSNYGEMKFSNISSSVSTSGFSYDETIYIYYTGSIGNSGSTSNATVTSISRTTAGGTTATGSFRNRYSGSIEVYINGYGYKTFYNYSDSAMSNAYALYQGDAVTMVYTGSLDSSDAYLSSIYSTDGNSGQSPVEGYVTSMGSNSITIYNSTYGSLSFSASMSSKYWDIYDRWQNTYSSLYYNNNNKWYVRIYFNGTISNNNASNANVTDVTTY